MRESQYLPSDSMNTTLVLLTMDEDDFEGEDEEWEQE